MEAAKRRLNSPVLLIVAGLALIATLALVGPAISGTSLPKLSKQVKKLKKQVKNISKQAGPQGPAGSNGSPGAAGPSQTIGRISGVPSVGVNWASPSGLSTPQVGNPSKSAMLSPNASIVVQDLSAHLSSAVTGTETRTLTLLDDGAATGVSCTMTATVSGGDDCQSTGSATVAAGSELALQSSESSTPPVSDLEFGWRATTP
jgi:hypothetical protein